MRAHREGVLLNMRKAGVSIDEKKVSTEAFIQVVATAGNDGRHRYQEQVIAS